MKKQFDQLNKRVDWYRPNISTELLKEFHMRNNKIALTHIGLHIIILIALGVLTLYSFNISLFLFFISLLIFGCAFNFLGFNGASHELSHKSVFTNEKVNNFFYYLFCFLLWNNPFIYKKSHYIHHRCSLHEHCDGEINAASRVNYRVVLNGIINIEGISRKIYFHVFNFFGLVKGEWPNAIFENQEKDKIKIIKWSRFLIIGHSIIAVLFLFNDMPILILIVNFGHFFGNLPNLILSRGQHNLMPMNRLDFRENTRTVKLNPVLEFFYWNMNYHIEHHMFPKIPFYNLKKIHTYLMNDMPESTKGIYSLTSKLL